MATEEIQFLDDELQNIYSEIRKGIEQLASMQGTADKKLEKYSHLTQRVSRARTAYQSFKVELRELRDEEKKTWSAKEKEHNQTITKLDSDIKMAKSNWERKDLMDGKERPQELNADSADTAALINHGKNIQAQSASSLDRSLKQVLATEQLGAETAIKLKQQTDQLVNIHKNVDLIESDLQRADKIMRAFMRRMATDKLILCFILLMIIGIIVIVVYKAQESSNPSPTPRPAPR